MEKLFSDAEKEKVNAYEYVTSHIRGLSDLYCQFDFRVTDDPCTVVDLRPEEEIVGQLTEFIQKGEADDFWLSPPSQS